MIWFKLGWRNLWRYKRRTIIELVSIGGSVFLAIWWNNLAVGTYDKLVNDGVRMGSGHIGVYHRDYLELRKTEQVIEATRLVSELECDPDVAGVFPRLHVPGLVRSSHESRAAGLEGLDFNREIASNPLLEPKRLVSGVLPAGDTKREAVIGETWARELSLEVGNKFVFMAQGADGEIVSTLLRVSGILRTNIREIDAGMIMIDRQRLGEIMGYKDSAHEIAIILKNHRIITTVIPRIKTIVGQYKDAEAYPWDDAMPALASSIHMDHIGLQITVIILFVIVGIGTVNTLLMSVMERTREFGMIRAIGVSKGGVRKMVVSEAFVLACAGVAIGVALGIVAGFYFKAHGIDFSGFIDEQGFGGTLFEPIMYSGWDIPGMIIIGTGMIFIALLASFYPAHHVLKISPSDAMRVY